MPRSYEECSLGLTASFVAVIVDDWPNHSRNPANTLDGAEKIRHIRTRRVQSGKAYDGGKPRSIVNNRWDRRPANVN